MIEDAVAKFLSAHAGLWFCHTCLSRRLGVGYDDVLAATKRLRLRSAFKVDGGRCSSCRRLRIVVIGAPRSSVTSIVRCAVCGKGIVRPADLVFLAGRSVAHRECAREGL
jgi:hypothetical protein